jgi:hypothetical protein
MFASELNKRGRQGDEAEGGEEAMNPQDHWNTVYNTKWRYSPDALAVELGEDFALLEWRPYRHITPWGAVQSVPVLTVSTRSLT